MKKEIEKFLRSGVTAYQIGKTLGIQPVQIQRYMNGEREIGNMTLDRAEQIYKLAKAYEEENKMKKEELVAYIEAFESDDNYQNEKIVGLTNREVSNLKHLLWNGDLFISTKGEYIESLEDFKSDLEDEEEIENMEDEITEVKGRNFDFVIERSGSDRPLFV